MPLKLGPLNVIEWEDSSSLAGAWNSIEDVRRSQPIICKSVGWVIAEDKRCVRLGAHINDDEVGGDICIPKSSIVKRRICR